MSSTITQIQNKPSRVRAGAHTVLLLTMILCGCSENSAPELLLIGPQEVYVNNRLEIELKATDPDGDSLAFVFQIPGVEPDSRIALVNLGGRALFHWTPNASDVGEHVVDFSVSDGQATDREPVSITIHAATDAETAPRFRRPLGRGEVLDLQLKSCIEVSVEIEDPDSTEVTISQDPTLEGATLTSRGPLSALVSWCPNAAQRGQPLHHLQLWADDHDNPPVGLTYEIAVLSKAPRVVISELLIDPVATGDDLGEWIELHNPTATEIDLDGWSLQDQAGSGQDHHLIVGPLTLAVGGYLVLARSADSTKNGGLQGAYSYGNQLQLANSVDELYLLDAEGRVVDSVEYLSSWPQSAGASISLKDPALDNNVAASWCIEAQPWSGSTGDYGSPGGPAQCP